MSDNAEFIILIIADTFLTHDYEYCLSIAKNDFSFVANSSLFEGNLTRFFSLASFKLFEHAIHADSAAFVDNFHILIQSLKSVQSAYNIYSATE